MATQYKVRALCALLTILGSVLIANAARHQIFKPRMDAQYTFAILSDIHIGESQTVSELNDNTDLN